MASSDSENVPSILQPGVEAPDFNLPSTPDQKVSLHEFRGNPTVLVFYPADWSPVCGDELAIINEVLPEIKSCRATVLGISVDNVWSHLAFAKARNLHFTLLSDFEPKGAAAKAYGAYETSFGVCKRAQFVIDPNGMIHWSYLAPIGVNPGVDGILEAIESLSSSAHQQVKQSHEQYQVKSSDQRI